MRACGRSVPPCGSLLNPLLNVCARVERGLVDQGGEMTIGMREDERLDAPAPVLSASAMTGDEGPSNTAFPCFSQRRYISVNRGVPNTFAPTSRNPCVCGWSGSRVALSRCSKYHWSSPIVAG